MADAAKRLIDCTEDDLKRIVAAEVAKAMAANSNPSSTQLLTTKQAAEYLGITRRVLQSHVSAGRIVPDSPQRPGFSCHRFSRATLDRFMVKL